MRVAIPTIVVATRQPVLCPSMRAFDADERAETAHRFHDLDDQLRRRTVLPGQFTGCHLYLREELIGS